MESCLEHLSAQERELPVSVDTLVQTEQAVQQLGAVESVAQVGVPQESRHDSLTAGTTPGESAQTTTTEQHTKYLQVEK